MPRPLFGPSKTRLGRTRPPYPYGYANAPMGEAIEILLMLPAGSPCGCMAFAPVVLG